MAGRLIIVSNRVPDLTERGAGGLTVALRAVLKRQKGIWFGWNGQIAESTDTTPVVKKFDDFDLVTIGLSEEDADEYYHGAGNQILWPLFHNRSDLIQIRSRYYDAYCRVNRRIARCLLDLVADDDIIWIQDFHLIPLGHELRAQGVRCKLGFFLHIPFPPHDVLTTLPWHEDIARWLGVYDLVGFQTERDLYNFQNYIQRRFDASLDGEKCEFAGFSCRAGVFPVTIDTSAWIKMVNEKSFEKETEAIRREVNPSPCSLIGVERLDYTKGLLRRYLAIEELLLRHDRFRGQVCLYQVVAPSRDVVPEYKALRKRLDEVSGRINSSFADFGWAPIHYLYRTFNQRELAALYHICRVGVVSPLIDGMNLVAKEYVASQNPKNPGVLVLSKFAGAADSLEGALLINPYDVESTSEAICTALDIPLEERVERWKSMMAGLESHDVHDWAREFLQNLH